MGAQRTGYFKSSLGNVSALWGIRKVDFLKDARDSSSNRLYNAVGVCSIFCKFEICMMHSELCFLWVTGKVNFSRVARDIPNHRFYNISISVRYSARFGLV